MPAGYVVLGHGRRLRGPWSRYSRELFYDTCGEAWFYYAKLKPLIPEARTKFSPDFLSNLEKAIEGTPEGRQRLQGMMERVEHFRTMSEESRKQKKTKVSDAA